MTCGPRAVGREQKTVLIFRENERQCTLGLGFILRALIITVIRGRPASAHSAARRLTYSRFSSRAAGSTRTWRHLRRPPQATNSVACLLSLDRGKGSPCPPLTPTVSSPVAAA